MALKTCITNYSFARSLRSGAMSIEGFCDFCGQAAFQGIDLISYFWKDKEAEMKKLPQWLKRNRLKLVGYGTRGNFLSHDAGEIKQSLENIREAVVDAARLGAKTCRVFGGSRFEGWTSQTALKQVVDAFQQVTPLAEENGVVLTIENHGGYPATSDEVIAVIKGVNSRCFASLLDTGNFLSAGEDPVKAAKNLAPWVKHVHVKDMLKFPPGSNKGQKASRADYHLHACAIGAGVVNNKEVFKVLRDAGYDDYLSIEAEGPDNEDEGQRVITGLAHIQKWLKEIGN